MAGITRVLLLALFFIGANSIEAKAIIANSKSPSESKQLFFLHNKTLVQITVSKKDDQIEKSILINEEVTDYALDELRERIFWVAKNGSVFVKPISGKLPAELVFAASEPGAKIAYDLLTDKLYFSNAAQDILALDLKHPSFRHGHVIVKNASNHRLHNQTTIKKIILDSGMGSMVVLYNDSNNRTDVYRYNMDGTDGTLIIPKSPYNYDLDLGSKEFHEDAHEFTIDESQVYWVYYTDDRSYKVIRTRGPQTERRPFAFLNAFDVDDIKNLKIYRESVKKHEMANPCAGKNNGGCGPNAMCLLKVLWPRKSCSHYSKLEIHGRLPRQIPFDMYHQQPTLRPEPQPTQPNNPYLPVYLSIIGK